MQLRPSSPVRSPVRLIAAAAGAIVALTVLLVLIQPLAGAGAPATWVVNSTEDDVDAGGCQQPPTGDCTLREAINALLTGDRIHFNIPPTDGNCVAGVACTISLVSTAPSLPAITRNFVVIDGYTQPGSSPNTNPVSQGINAQPMIRIIRVGEASGTGLTIEASNVTVRGLIINKFNLGIEVSGGSGNKIAGNFIGPNPSGTTATQGNFQGITVQGSGQSTVIGGTAEGDRNLISGNTVRGVTVLGDGTAVQGNIIGADATGTAALGNSTGVRLMGSQGVTIGGTEPGARNLISGNASSGVSMDYGASDNVVAGNYIGTNISGGGALPNGSHGILISYHSQLGPSSDNVVGGSTAGARNVISGNTGDGVLIQSSGGSVGNEITGNYIGTNAAGTAAIANGGAGVTILESNLNVVGGEGAGEGNVISGNDQHGVLIALSSNTTVQGNYIGTNSSGSGAIGNGNTGVQVSGSGNTIGGTSGGARNVISGNGGYGGIDMRGTSLTIQGNYVGLNASGDSAIPNVGAGISLLSGGTLVGGGASGAGNVISGNTGPGIYIGAPEVAVQGSNIGTDASGFDPIPNQGHGITVGPAGAYIGGTGTGEGNLIAYNQGDGLRVYDETAVVKIAGNSIHSNTGLGIELQEQTDPDVLGVTENDPGDTDQGPNGLQNFPELTAATQPEGTATGGLAGQSAPITTVTFAFDSIASTEFRLEFFTNDECDPSGHGEGQDFLGGGNLSTDGDGIVEGQATTEAPVHVGQYITATATNVASGDTSEFSNCVQVVSASTPTPTPSPSAPVATLTPTPTPTPTPPGLTPTPTPTPPPTPSPPGQTPTPTPTGQTSTPTPTPTPTTAPGELSHGDNDCDGDTDAVDALQGLRYVAGLVVNQQPDCLDLGAAVPAGGEPQLFGDIDCDGDVDAVDALQILRSVAGLPVNQEEGCPAIGGPL